MDVDWNLISSFFLSLVLHFVLAVFLVFSFDTPTRKVPKPAPQVEIIQAVSVDAKEVEKELQRLKSNEEKKKTAEQKKQKELEKKLRDLEKKAKSAEKSRKTEEKRLAELKKKKAAETKKRVDEEKKLAQLKKEKEELEKKRVEEKERLQKEEEERKQKEALKRKKEEEERTRLAEEKRRQEELAEEQKQMEAAQKSRDQQLLRQIVLNIKRRIVSNFNKSGLPAGLECVLSVQLVPGGEVVSVTVSKSSGNEIFDRRAQVAVQRASPLPIPEDVATFERLRLRKFAFRFKPEG